MSDPRIVIAQTPKWVREERQAETALKIEQLVAERQALARKAFDALWSRRHDLGRRLHQHLGIWVEELAPLEPKERTIVVEEFKRCLDRVVEVRTAFGDG